MLDPLLIYNVLFPKQCTLKSVKEPISKLLMGGQTPASFKLFKTPDGWTADMTCSSKEEVHETLSTPCTSMPCTYSF